MALSSVNVTVLAETATAVTKICTVPLRTMKLSTFGLALAKSVDP